MTTDWLVAQVSKLRKRHWLRRGAHIVGFAGNYKFKCNRPDALYLSECLVEEGVEFRIALPRGMQEIHVLRGAWIGRNTTLSIAGRCEILDHSMVAANCYLSDWSHGIARGLPMIRQPLISIGLREEMRIGPDAWIGANVVIIGSIHIGEGAVIGAGSFVNTDVPPFEIWAGSPARRIGKR